MLTWLYSWINSNAYITESVNKIPDYSSIYGPSVLVCPCGYNYITTDGEDNKITMSPISQVVDRIHTNRAEHMKTCNFMESTLNKVNDCTLHMPIAKCIQKNFPDAKTVTSEIILKVLNTVYKPVTDRKQDIVTDIFLITKAYIVYRNNLSDADRKVVVSNASIDDKIKYELSRLDDTNTSGNAYKPIRSDMFAFMRSVRITDKMRNLVPVFISTAFESEDERTIVNKAMTA